MLVERSPESCRGTGVEHLHIWVSTSVFIQSYSSLCPFEHLGCVPVWHLVIYGLHEIGCLFLNWPTTPGLKLEAKSHLPRGSGSRNCDQKKHVHAAWVRRCLIRTTSQLLCVLRTGLLMSLCAYCMCESRCVGSSGWGKLQDQFHVCVCFGL